MSYVYPMGEPNFTGSIPVINPAQIPNLSGLYQAVGKNYTILSQASGNALVSNSAAENSVIGGDIAAYNLEFGNGRFIDALISNKNGTAVASICTFRFKIGATTLMTYGLTVGALQLARTTKFHIEIQGRGGDNNQYLFFHIETSIANDAAGGSVTPLVPIIVAGANKTTIDNTVDLTWELTAQMDTADALIGFTMGHYREVTTRI